MAEPDLIMLCGQDFDSICCLEAARLNVMLLADYEIGSGAYGF